MIERILTLVCHPDPYPDPDDPSAPARTDEPGLRSVHRLLAAFRVSPTEVLCTGSVAALEAANIIAAASECSLTVVEESDEINDALNDPARFDEEILLVASELQLAPLIAEAFGATVPPWGVAVTWPNGLVFSGPTALEAALPLEYIPFLRNSVPEGLAAQLLAGRELFHEPNGLASRLSLRGSLLRGGRFYEQSRAALEAALRLAQAEADGSLVAVTRLRMAILLQYEGKFEEAANAFEIARNDIREHALQHEHFFEQHLGKFMVERGEIERGIEHLQRAASLRQGSDPVFVASTEKALAAAGRRLRESAT